MPDRDQIRQTLIDLIENDTGERFDDLADAQDLRLGLGLDSVDVVSVVSQVERKFRVRLTQHELEKLITAGDLLDLLQAKLSAPPTSSAA